MPSNDYCFAARQLLDVLDFRRSPMKHRPLLQGAAETDAHPPDKLGAIATYLLGQSL
jgi:hypothetical protein